MVSESDSSRNKSVTRAFVCLAIGSVSLAGRYVAPVTRVAHSFRTHLFSARLIFTTGSVHCEREIQSYPRVTVAQLDVSHSVEQ